jgi:hypothetical protein
MKTRADRTSSTYSRLLWSKHDRIIVDFMQRERWYFLWWSRKQLSSLAANQKSLAFGQSKDYIFLRKMMKNCKISAQRVSTGTVFFAKANFWTKTVRSTDPKVIWIEWGKMLLSDTNFSMLTLICSPCRTKRYQNKKKDDWRRKKTGESINLSPVSTQLSQIQTFLIKTNRKKPTQMASFDPFESSKAKNVMHKIQFVRHE